MNVLGISREAAESLAEDVPRRPGWASTQWTFRENGDSLLVKDNRYSGFLYRYTIGRFLRNREARACARADGLPFLPRFYGRLDRDALIFEKVEARPLKHLSADELPTGFLKDLEDCIRALHQRGVVHLDLRHGGNILITPEGKPKIVDFESALCLGSVPLLGHLIFPVFAWVDRSAILKIHAKYCPDEMTEDERKRYRRFRLLRLLWPIHRGLFRWKRPTVKH